MTDLYRVLLCFRDGKNLQFCFRSESTAEAFYQATKPIRGGVSIMSEPSLPAEAKDDYGNTATVVRGDVSAAVKTFVNEDLNSQQDLSILQAHGQVKLNNRIGADPMLKAAMAMQQMNGRAGLA